MGNQIHVSINYFFRSGSKTKNQPAKYTAKIEKDLSTEILKKALAQKISKCSGKPETSLYISVPLLELYSSKSYARQYSRNEDKYLYCKMNEIGIDTENVYKKIKEMIINEPKFQYTNFKVFRLIFFGFSHFWPFELVS